MNRKFIKLKKFKYKKGDFLHHKCFAAIDPASLPSELLFLSPILDQGQLPACSAYASTAVRDAMKNKLYDPQIQWHEEQQFCNSTLEDGVSDMRVPMAVGVETGFVPIQTPLPVDKASTWYAVAKNGGMDLFDSCRVAMAQAQCPLVQGVFWMNEWSNVPDGVVQNDGTTVDGGHAIKIAGFTNKQRNGSFINLTTEEPYLVLQNSWNTNVGDEGLFYFPRSVVNDCFGSLGTLYWSDTTNPTIQALGRLQALWLNILQLL